MLSNPFAASTGYIGIDFASRCVKMVQVREQSAQINVIAAARIDTGECRNPAERGAVESVPSPVGSDDDPLARQIRAAFISGGFKGTRCIISLPREDVHLQSIRLPRMPDEELRQTAMWEASQRFGLDRNAMQVDFIRTGATLASAATTESREEVILVAASHSTIHARVESVLAAGLRPIAVEPGFWALVRTFSRQSRRESDRQSVRAVVEVGESGATVLILRGDQVAFCKPIAIGGRLLNLAVADHLQVSESQAADLRSARIARESDGRNHREDDPSTERAVYEAVRPLIGDLVKEVMLCLRYYGVTFRGHAPDRIILTGGDGLEPKLGEVLANTCNTPVVFDDATNILTTSLPTIHAILNQNPGTSASWAVPLGLSMRGLKRRASKPSDSSTHGEAEAPSMNDKSGRAPAEIRRSAAA